MLLNYDKETSSQLEIKAKDLKNDQAMNLDMRLKLWHETVHIRRKSIRDRATSEIVDEFPDYQNSVFVSFTFICNFAKMKHSYFLDL